MGLVEPVRVATDEVTCAVHFVGFRGEEYWSAVKIWGRPGFVHMGNDRRMRREITDGDTVVFANGCETRPSDRNFLT